MSEEPLVPLAAVTWLGQGLKRPECVLTTAKGELFAGDHNSGIASVAFGGPDLKTVFLGNLAGESIPTFKSPIAGAEPVQ